MFHQSQPRSTAFESEPQFPIEYMLVYTVTQTHKRTNRPVRLASNKKSYKTSQEKNNLKSHYILFGARSSTQRAMKR